LHLLIFIHYYVLLFSFYGVKILISKMLDKMIVQWFWDEQITVKGLIVKGIIVIL
jgi:hypothetical protein